MMKRSVFAVLAASGLLFSSAVTAQEDVAAAPDELDCAIWAAYKIGAASEGDDITGLSAAMTYFIGLFEGSSGTPFEDPMTERANAMTEADIERIEPACVGWMVSLGDRLVAWSGEEEGAE